MAEAGPALGGMVDEAKRLLASSDCNRVVVFDSAQRVLFGSCKALPGDLQSLASSFGDRDTAVQQGLWLEGRRYEVHMQAVHRHHPPLVYGRAMADCEPELSTGIAVCRVEQPLPSITAAPPCYVAVTYEQPHTSARIIPRVLEFVQRHLQAEQ